MEFALNTCIILKQLSLSVYYIYREPVLGIWRGSNIYGIHEVSGSILHLDHVLCGEYVL